MRFGLGRNGGVYYDSFVTDAARLARGMWTLIEPVHAVTYFGPQALTAFTELGLRGFWRGYFAGRSAPLGEASPQVVTAVFHTFAPSFVARAVPGIWDLTTPANALAARVDGAARALSALPAARDTATSEIADLLCAATEDLDCSGRALAAANSALPAPDHELGRLWWAATLLREHRGDGHFAALTAAGIDGCEAIVLRCAMDLEREPMQRMRGWTDEQWEAARARLIDRGWLTGDGALTDAGRRAHADVENATDRAASRPWARLGADRTAHLSEKMLPLASACAALPPFTSPSGVPAPAPVHLPVL